MDGAGSGPKVLPYLATQDVPDIDLLVATHPHEDHMFIVLQGSAEFHGADGELAALGAHEGIMLPKGSYYRFHATSVEPLVLLRVGTPNQGPDVKPKRIDPAGEPMVGDSKANKTVPVRFRDGEYFG